MKDIEDLIYFLSEDGLRSWRFAFCDSGKVLKNQSKKLQKEKRLIFERMKMKLWSYGLKKLKAFQLILLM